MVKSNQHYGPSSRKLKQLPSNVDLSNQSDGYVRNQKGYLIYVWLNGKGVRDLNDTYSIYHATWPNNMNCPESTRDGRDLILASKLSGIDQVAGGEILYVLPTWQDTLHYST